METIWTDIWTAIVNLLQQYFETELPKVTLDSFVDIWEFSSKTLIEVAREYISVIFA